MFKLVLVSLVTIGSLLCGFKLSANPPSAASANLLVPMVIKKTGQVERAMDIFSRLLEERIIYLSGAIDNQSGDLIVAQLLFLDSEDSTKDIKFYINSPGGSITDTMAVYDTMQQVKADVCTFGVGLCASGGSLLLTAGAKDKRHSLANTRIMMHQPHINSVGGQVSDVANRTKELMRQKDRLIEIYSHHTGKDPEQILDDIDRDNYMSPEEALAYGLVDEVIENL